MTYEAERAKLLAAQQLEARLATLLAACTQAREALAELIGADYDLAGDLAMLDAAITKAKGSDE